MRFSNPALAVLVVLVVATAPLHSELTVDVSTLATDLDGAVGGVAVDRMGTVYVADFGDKVWKLSPWGDVEVFARGLYGSSGNAVDGEGRLLQANFFGNTLSRIERDGTVTTLARGLNGPVGVAVTSDGKVYVCNCSGNEIVEVGDDGTVSTLASGELFNCPNGITVDGDDVLHVVNFSDGRMIRLTKEGEATLFATIPGGGNGHIAWIGPDIYVTGFRASGLYRVTPEGEVSLAAGNGSFGDVDGSGHEAGFASPNGLAYDRTRDVLYTNDHLIPWSERFSGHVRPRSSVRRIAFPNLQEAATELFDTEGIEGAKRFVREYRAARPARANELQLNLFGYGLLQAGRVPEAIAVFELNAEFHPDSFNVWDSLGEGLKAAGRREEAIANYRRSLELNPDNGNATRMLAELEAE